VSVAAGVTGDRRNEARQKCAGPFLDGHDIRRVDLSVAIHVTHQCVIGLADPARSKHHRGGRVRSIHPAITIDVTRQPGPPMSRWAHVSRC
jgi:hypothetical protein